MTLHINIYRDAHIKLEQPEDEESNIVLSMVDDINDAESSFIDVGSEVTGSINDDIRDESGDVDIVSQYGIPLQMPLSDSLLPTAGDSTDPSLSSHETQSQVE